MKININHAFAAVLVCLSAGGAWAQSPIINAYGRNSQSLNGEWHSGASQRPAGVPFSHTILSASGIGVQPQGADIRPWRKKGSMVYHARLLLY